MADRQGSNDEDLRRKLKGALIRAQSICDKRDSFRFKRFCAELCLDIDKVSMIVLIAVAATISLFVSNLGSIIKVLDKEAIQASIKLLFWSGSLGLMQKIFYILSSFEVRSMDLLLSVDLSDHDKFIKPIEDMAIECGIDISDGDNENDLAIKDSINPRKSRYPFMSGFWLLCSGVLFGCQLSTFYSAVKVLINGINL